MYMYVCVHAVPSHCTRQQVTAEDSSGTKWTLYPGAYVCMCTCICICMYVYMQWKGTGEDSSVAKGSFYPGAYQVLAPAAVEATKWLYIEKRERENLFV